jgi:hypothetical protein
MTDKPQIGKNNYNEVLRRGRAKTKNARDALRRIVEESPGPQTQALLLTKAALCIGDIEAIWRELDEIGRQAKNLKDKG